MSGMSSRHLDLSEVVCDRGRKGVLFWMRASILHDSCAQTDCIQFGFLAESSGQSVSRILADRASYALRAVAPFDIVRTFRVPFFFPVQDHNIRFDATICGKSDRGSIAALEGFLPA
jgi:hypothetical protein